MLCVCVCLCLCVSVYSDQVSMGNQARRNPLNKTDAQPHQIANAATALCLCIFEWLKWPTLGFHTAARITHTPPGALRKLHSGFVSQAINQANWHVPWTNTCIAMQQGSHVTFATPLPSFPCWRNSFRASGHIWSPFKWPASCLLFTLRHPPKE